MKMRIMKKMKEENRKTKKSGRSNAFFSFITLLFISLHLNFEMVIY